MYWALRITVAAGGSALGGAVAGFVAAVLVLQAKGLRNAWLIARGQPGIKDCVLPLSFVLFSAIVSLLLGAVLGAFMAPARAIALGAAIPAGLLTLLGVAGAAWQARDNTR